MNNDVAVNIIKENLGKAELTMVKAIEALSAQGYLVNRTKLIKLNVLQMLKHCYNNATIFNATQDHNLSDIVMRL